MSIFDILPIVNRCCCCIDLKIGTIIITVVLIHASGPSLYTIAAQEPICMESESQIAKIMRYVVLVGIGFDLMLMITGIIFLIGVCNNSPTTAEIFLYAMLVSELVYITNAILCIVSSTMDESCCNFNFIFKTFFNVVLIAYVMVIVRSYKEEMQYTYD